MRVRPAVRPVVPLFLGLALALPLVPGCGGPGGGAALPSTSGGEGDDGENPFLQDQTNRGKEDTAYQNPDGIEVEVDLEADVEAPPYRTGDAPAQLGQFALTYLRKRGEFYLESLAEDATSGRRVEWLLDGEWVSAEAARSTDPARLRHFRIRAVNAVLLLAASRNVTEGTVFRARVPLRPYTVMADAGDRCADPDGHIRLDQSVYWYLWNPDRPGCTLDTQEMTVTVSRLLPRGNVTYPEYDQLVADGKVTAVILFGQIGDGPITDSDPGVTGMRRMARWLREAGFTEVAPAPVGQRFTRHIGQVDFEIDLYSPRDFSGLSDYAHIGNFEKALAEHEIVTYDGHSMLGASDFWERKYPDFYQIFLYGGCLGYEYYVRPILAGKGGWDRVDILSSVVEVSASANEFAAPVLAKVAWALDHGYAASWQDILRAVRERVGDSTFGVSGARDNCFSPTGSLCRGSEGRPPTEVRRFESTPGLAIPDNDPAGVSSELQVPAPLRAASVTLELDVSHSYVSDLRITLTHGGKEVVVWDRAGGDGDGIAQSVGLDAFAGEEVGGTWTLRIVDAAAQDVGTLNRWALVVEPGQGS